MKDKTITVYTETGMGLLIYEEVADRLNLKNYSKVSGVALNNLLIENAKEGIARCQLELATNEVFDNEDTDSTTNR